MNLQNFLLRQWEKKGIWAWLTSPLGVLVCLLTGFKRQAYQRGLFNQIYLDTTVIVVGNLKVGGAGKTPLVVHIAHYLARQGYQPGIISRGYKGDAQHWPQRVTSLSDPLRVGDEPVMLARLTACPVMAGPDRVACAQQLIADQGCDVIVSDDGFQHLKLARDIDILVFDTAHNHGLGNGWCLPSGPLREAASAARHADMCVNHGTRTDLEIPGRHAMRLIPGKIYSLQDNQLADVESLQSQTLHALAGIGLPERFFSTLRDAGFSIIEHAFDDHHRYTLEDLQFDDNHQLITTEKDAIKLATLHSPGLIWVLPVRAELTPDFDTTLLHKLKTAN